MLAVFVRCVLPGPFAAKRVAAVACCHCLLLMLRGIERGTSTHKHQKRVKIMQKSSSEVGLLALQP